ncbi:MAG TPA: hypothetical protein VLE97_11350 [Gaiellaceae bacterium]|nr:hypothetical protein [Gaiellaceae bacterium]
MNLSVEDVRDIRAIADALIGTLEHQVALKMVAEGNVAIDAVINCLCYAMKRSSRLEDADLLRRVAKYFEMMNLPGAPGRADNGGEPR